MPLNAVLLLALFVADVTPPVGHPLCGGLVKPAERIAAPLQAHGFVLLGHGKPIVFCAVDWCEIHNDAHDAWRAGLAEAAGTTTDRVMVVSLHLHDAPLDDLEARRLLEAQKETRGLTDPAFHEAAVQRTAAALRESLKSPQPVTHIGVGQGKVEQVASSRRVLQADGKVHDVRYSACKDATLRAAPEGTIDPYLKTLTFWNGERALAAMHCYATHPISYYGEGDVSADFFGLARAHRQADDPFVAQIITTGCAGDIGAGKYNDGSHPMRAILADRVYKAMLDASKATKRYPLERIDYRVEPLTLPLKPEPEISAAALRKKLEDPEEKLAERVRAATVLSWVKRVQAGRKIDVPVLDLGHAQLVVLPGEPFVEFQLAAQRMRPDSFVMVIGYGDLGPGYLPLDRAYQEGGYEPGDWSFVGPGTEPAVMAVLRKALGGGEGRRARGEGTRGE
jgi:hypothetical protein